MRINFIMVNNGYELLLFFFFLMIFLIFCSESMMSILMTIEMLMMILFFLMIIFHEKWFSHTVLIVYLTFLVCESTLGLGSYIKITRYSGNDSFISSVSTKMFR
uniref:NADH dehydrogenase subunit 4L n=1 Tax=Piagetiella africana TaxID=2965260 RepID=UPI00286C3D3B|nr:NADH dehydrogenase subunit 4L [Piagetiella africana]WKF19583.1 NADH dehydrogenase subunit 4L [Piagetiella africana]